MSEYRRSRRKSRVVTERPPFERAVLLLQADGTRGEVVFDYLKDA